MVIKRLPYSIRGTLRIAVPKGHEYDPAHALALIMEQALLEGEVRLHDENSDLAGECTPEEGAALNALRRSPLE